MIVTVSKGNDLPSGTYIYYYANDDTTWMGIIGLGDFRLYYIYSYDDGLWATDKARDVWKRHPHRHPHITLFGILYKKLEI